MNQNQLKNQAKSRRQTVTEEHQTTKWECKYCHFEFKSETRYMNHTCKEKRKYDEVRSTVGQAAFDYYNEWMKQRKYGIQKIENFTESRYYSTFIKFTNWVNEVCIIYPNRYITMMVEQNIPPSLWTRPALRESYIIWYNKTYPPNKQVIDSYDEIQKICFDWECQPKDLFYTLPIRKIIELIRKGKLSVWILLSSDVFKKWANEDISQTEKEALLKSIDVMTYIKLFKENPEYVRDFKEICSSMGI